MAAASHVQTLGSLDAWNDAASPASVAMAPADVAWADITWAGPVLPDLSASVAAPGANGVLTFTGVADAGSIVEIAEWTAGGVLSLIGQATADAGGAFSFAFPEAALGYGAVTLAVREVSASWQPGGWSAGTQYSFADPETGLRHVGADLAAKLGQDAATGADATADLQAVADEVTEDGGAPAVLDIPAGTYRISGTILLHSGTYMDDPGVTLEAAADWHRPVPDTTAGSLLGYTMVANADYASTTVQDSAIQIRNVAFDWNGFEDPGSAAVRFIDAGNVLVQDSSFAGNEDGTAFLHSDGAVVNGCVAVGTTNYAFDNWDGPTDTVIENSTADVAAGSGIAITARGTAVTDDATADHDTLIGNTIYGASGPGIVVESLSLTSAVDDILVAGNLLVGPGAGVSVTGTGSGAVIAGNTISGSLQTALVVSNIGLTNAGTAGLQQQNVIVAGNTIGNALVPGGAAIVVQAQGAGVFGNTVQYGGQRNDLWLTGDNETSSFNTWDDWQTGAVTTAWAVNATVLDAPGSSSSPGTGQAPYSLNNGTLTITGAGTLDLRGRPGISAVQAGEGIGETVFLPNGGVQVTVTSAPGSGLPGTVGFGAPGFADGLTIYGAAADDTIDLGAGDDAVVLGGTQEVVHGGGGADTFYVTAATAGATIGGGTGDGSGGASQLVVSGGGAVTLGAGITNIATVRIEKSTGPTTLALNGLAGLAAYASNAGDTLIAGGTDQRLVAGALTDTLVGIAAGGITFAGVAAGLEGDVIEEFALGDTIDVTSVGTAGAGFNWNTTEAPGMTTVNVFDGHDGTAIKIAGTIDGTRFHLVPDAGLGVELVFAPGIYTVNFGGEINTVLARIDVGGTDAAADTAFTMLFGGSLAPGGTVALKAGMPAVDLPMGASLTIDGTGHTLETGTNAGLTVAAGDVTVQNLAMIGAGGGIALNAGTLRLDAAGSFGGGVAIGGGALRLGAAGAAGTGAIDFIGAATLEIAGGVSVANVIDGFSGQDIIFADGIGNGTAHYDSATHQLTISGIGGSVDLLVSGNYFANGFEAKPEGSATAVAYVACFVAGTRILTPLGEVAVDDLRIGDRVVTVSGAARPVKWIGRRSYPASVVAKSVNLRPVIVRTDALGPGMPMRDLAVSPMHALLIDAILIPAVALVNGRSILRAAPSAVDYVHVELDHHDVIFAEGAPAETFRDDHSRAGFANASEFADLYGTGLFPPPLFAPRIEEGHRLEAIRRRLFGDRPRTGIRGALAGNVERLMGGSLEGWAMDRDDPATPVALDVLVDGAIVASVLANRYRVDLDRAGFGDGCCGFTVAVRGCGDLSRILVRRVSKAGALPQTLPKAAPLETAALEHDRR